MNALRNYYWLLATLAWAFCSSGCQSARPAFSFDHASPSALPAPANATAAPTEPVKPGLTLPQLPFGSGGKPRLAKRPVAAHLFAPGAGSKRRASRFHVWSLSADSTKRRPQTARHREALPAGKSSVPGLLFFGSLALLGGFLLRQSAITGATMGAAFGESLVKAYFASALILLGVLALLAVLVILAVNNSKKRTQSRS